MDKATILLTDRCRFHAGDAPDAWQAWFSDSDWQEVFLPHDWSVSFPFSREYSSGTGYLAGGIGWYRIHIAPKPEWKGRRLSLVFDGVYKNSRVWCNSYYLGERPNGYISFSYDVTEQFHFDRDNVIAVRVDHSDISDSRWFTGSGITRQVRLVVQDPVHPVYNGIFFTTPSVTPGRADAVVYSEIVNTLDEPAQVTVTNTLLDSQGQPAASGSVSASLKKGQTQEFAVSMELASPALWSPQHPALYTLRTSLFYKTSEGDEVSGIADERRVGVRSFSFDADHGFFLNGEPAVLKGVCVHHDAGCLGAAVYAPVWKRRLLKLKKMGCNAIRMSHNPHMPQLYDLCDELGFFVMDEAFDEWEGPKNKWWQGHNVYPPRHQGYYVDFPQWHEKDLTDLIRRDRNHPSIILWSIGNEIDYPNDPYCHPSFSTMTGNNDANKPAQERQYNPDRPNAERLAPLADRLCRIVKRSDNTRPVTLAAAFPELSAKIGFLDSLDVAGYNYKEHLYEESHAAFPGKPFLGSENGHSLAAWKAVTDNDYISGQFLWTGIDYLGEAHGWPIHGSAAGLLTLAGFEKPGYYRRQSFWSDQPMLHLTTAPAESDCGEFTPVSECWNYPDGSEVLVKCYTNLPAAEFFLNGKSLGVRKKASDSDCISLTVPFEAGTLSALALSGDVQAVLNGSGNKQAASGGSDDVPAALNGSSNAPLPSDRLTTTGCACRIGSSYTSDPLPETSAVLYQVELTMQDHRGLRVTSDSTCLHVTVENGRLLGMENGDLSDVTDYSAAYRRAYHGQLLLYVLSCETKKAPSVCIRADGIRPVRFSLNG